MVFWFRKVRCTSSATLSIEERDINSASSSLESGSGSDSGSSIKVAWPWLWAYTEEERVVEEERAVDGLDRT